jgi:hypothetical protein
MAAEVFEVGDYVRYNGDLYDDVLGGKIGRVTRHRLSEDPAIRLYFCVWPGCPNFDNTVQMVERATEEDFVLDVLAAMGVNE